MEREYVISYIVRRDNMGQRQKVYMTNGKGINAEQAINNADIPANAEVVSYRDVNEQ